MQELEADLASKEERCLDEVERHRTSLTRFSPGSRVKVAAAHWYLAKLALGHEPSRSSGTRTKRRKEEDGRVTEETVLAQLLFVMSPHCGGFEPFASGYSSCVSRWLGGVSPIFQVTVDLSA